MCACEHAMTERPPDRFTRHERAHSTRTRKTAAKTATRASRLGSPDPVTALLLRQRGTWQLCSNTCDSPGHATRARAAPHPHHTPATRLVMTSTKANHMSAGGVLFRPSILPSRSYTTGHGGRAVRARKHTPVYDCRVSHWWQHSQRNHVAQDLGSTAGCAISHRSSTQRARGAGARAP